VNKLCTLPLLAGPNISAEFVNPTVGSCIDYVVHCQMLHSGNRTVQEIASVSWDLRGNGLEVTQVKL
jgi:pilus assembly protein CpaF